MNVQEFVVLGSVCVFERERERERFALENLVFQLATTFLFLFAGRAYDSITLLTSSRTSLCCMT